MNPAEQVQWERRLLQARQNIELCELMLKQAQERGDEVNTEFLGLQLASLQVQYQQIAGQTE